MQENGQVFRFGVPVQGGLGAGVLRSVTFSGRCEVVWGHRFFAKCQVPGCSQGRHQVHVLDHGRAKGGDGALRSGWILSLEKGLGFRV